MILVDTSIWVDHLRRGNAVLQQQLAAGVVLIHPFVLGEIACGTLRDRSNVLGLLRALPAVYAVEHDEALAFVERYALGGLGVGWIDVHVLAAARLYGVDLWTLDRALAKAASSAGVDLARTQ